MLSKQLSLLVKVQKFRSGGFNVIVATSIGEEGLDIMEVDLVICFDANFLLVKDLKRIAICERKQMAKPLKNTCGMEE